MRESAWAVERMVVEREVWPELWKLDAFTISYRVVIMVRNHTSGDGVGLESRKGAGTRTGQGGESRMLGR